MKRLTSYLTFVLILTLIFFSTTHASEVTIPNSFQSGATAVASEVNDNFTAVETAVDDNDSRIAELEALVATLQTRIAELEDSEVMALGPYVSVDEISDSRGPLVQLSGVNLQIVNGEGSTESINGLGNVIIGYDEVTELTSYYYCSDPAYTNETACATAGEVWSNSLKIGSHYLVLGSQNNYSRYGGFVSGYRNYARGIYSNVSGGNVNDATGDYSSVSGGTGGDATGTASSISGGNGNYATGECSSVSGGSTNYATGSRSTISSGNSNVASGRWSSVNGGASNSSSGDYSSILGGNRQSVSTAYGTSP